MLIVRMLLHSPVDAVETWSPPAGSWATGLLLLHPISDLPAVPPAPFPLAQAGDPERQRGAANDCQPKAGL